MKYIRINNAAFLRSFSLAGLVCIFAYAKNNIDNPGTGTVVITATGNIHPKLNEFRKLLGGNLNTTPNAIGGRREINWDGLPDSFVGKALPLDFLNPTGADAQAGLQRGLVYASSGEFRISNSNFSDVNPASSSEFASFSGKKTFANISSNLWEVVPKKPGANRSAFIRGFGIVFSDVDKDNSTAIEFFNEEKSLGKFFAPAHSATSSFSFLGVYFKNEEVTRVQVSHDGNLASGEIDITQGGAHDLVVLDDFLYSEPVAKD